jgi:fatty-acyl-CoA synthase
MSSLPSERRYVCVAGVTPGDVVGTLAWNTYRHMEVWYAVMGIAAVCHTMNPRLYPEQLSYIANHAEDKVSPRVYS